LSTLEDFSSLLKGHRKRLHISQTQVAILCNMDHSNICRYENNKREPDYYTVKLMAQALNLNGAETLEFFIAAGVITDHLKYVMKHDASLRNVIYALAVNWKNNAA